MKYLEGYYKLYGYKYNKEDSSFELENVKIYMSVETESGPYYTIKPMISIIYKDVFEKINFIISNCEDLKVPNIFFNSYFYLDFNLSNNICEFDKKEFINNKYYENELFEFRISNPVNVLETFSMHKKYMEQVGFNAVQTFNHIEYYYEFLIKVYLNLFTDYENYPDKKLTERPFPLKVNDIYTLAYLGKSRDSNFVNELVERYESVLGEHHYNPISMAKCIINYL